MKRWLYLPMAFLLAFVVSPAVTADTNPPGNSLYQLHVELTGPGHEAGTDFAVFRGQPVLVSMFYGSCPHVCPMLISSIKMMEKQLPPEQRGNLRVLLLSLDPARDSMEKLAELAARHDVNSERWLLARASKNDVRKLAAVLGIKYRKLPDGNFNHTTVIRLLSPRGVPLAQTSQLGVLDTQFMQILRKKTDVK